MVGDDGEGGQHGQKDTRTCRADHVAREANMGEATAARRVGPQEKPRKNKKVLDPGTGTTPRRMDVGTGPLL